MCIGVHLQTTFKCIYLVAAAFVADKLGNKTHKSKGQKLENCIRFVEELLVLRFLGMRENSETCEKPLIFFRKDP